MFFLLNISTTIKAQINITPLELRTSNQIFIEHKNQKLIISEQKSEIIDLNNKVDTYKTKVNTLNKVIDNQKEILNLNKEKAEIERNNLNNQLSTVKKQKNQMTIIAVIATVIATGVIFVK